MQIPSAQETIDAFKKLLQIKDRGCRGSKILPTFNCDINAPGFTGKEIPPDNETEMVSRVAGSLDEVNALRLCFSVWNEAFPLDRLYGTVDLSEISQGFLTPQPKPGGVHKVRNRFAVTYGASHGEVIEEFRQSSGVVHVDMSEENIVHPLNPPGGERVDEFRH